MQNRTVVDTLNYLLSVEFANPIGRLREAGAFVSLGSSADRAMVRDLLERIDSHEKKLADAILKRRGAPVSRRIDISTAEYHYLDLKFMMPQILKSVRTLVRAYEAAGATGDDEADALIGSHLSNYKKILETLERMHSHLVESAG